MQCYKVYLYLETALHVSGGTSTHHQEHTRLYIQHLVLVKLLLLPATIAAGNSNGALAKAVSRLPLNAEVHVRFQVRACEFRGVKCGTGKGFAPNTSDFLSK